MKNVLSSSISFGINVYIIVYYKSINREIDIMIYIYIYYFTLLLFYETIKRELQIKPISECRCDERLKTKAEESTRLSGDW